MHAMVRSLCAVSEYNYSLLLEVTQTNLQPHVILLFFQNHLKIAICVFHPQSSSRLGHGQLVVSHFRVQKRS
jgi:hypothetical protein